MATKPLLRHLPKFQYRGLTIVMSNPSRFDANELLSGVAGYKFNNECLSPETNRYCCEIRLADDPAPLLSDTKCLLLLGQKALFNYSGATTHIGEQRGSPLLSKQGIPAIASFLPQDACDIVNFEAQFNSQAKGFDEEADKDYIGDKSRSATARQNWFFWLKQDCKKASKIVTAGGHIPASPYVGEYILRPALSDIIHELTTNKNKDLFIDIETDFHTLDMRCFAFSFGPRDDAVCPVYIIPFLDCDYRPSYGFDGNAQILRALAIAFRDNTTVAHNGAVFDFLVFAHKYRIPVGRKLYDTMLAQHRCFPETEKSLGHCVSMWTWEPYHKNEGVHSYANAGQAEQLYRYCGKDVYTMVLIKKAQLEYAAKIPGLPQSIAQANASIRPYLITTLLGIHYNEEMRAKWVRDNDKLCEQYLRIIRILCGSDVAPLLSNKACCKYFHEQLGYDVVLRSKLTGRPSLGKDALLKLKLKHVNPVIDFLLKLRELQKESSAALTFVPWRI